jgi:hypothetical protein
MHGLCLADIVDDAPRGYPRLANCISSDENFLLYRRFGYLQARVLLNKQDQLRELEMTLDALDAFDAKHAPEGLRSREKDEATSDKRRDLLGRIEQKYKEYGLISTV